MSEYKPKVIEGKISGTGWPIDGHTLILASYDYDNHESWHLCSWKDEDDPAVMDTIFITETEAGMCLYDTLEEFMKNWEKWEPEGSFCIPLENVEVGNRHSAEDYKSIMNYARITTPAVKENYVDIPGENSSLDLTEAVSGVTFNDGQISFKFTFFKEDDRSRMKNDLHGKKVKIILEREPEYYYDSRLFCRDGDYTGNIYELYIDARRYMMISMGSESTGLGLAVRNLRETKGMSRWKRGCKVSGSFVGWSYIFRPTPGEGK